MRSTDLRAQLAYHRQEAAACSRMAARRREVGDDEKAETREDYAKSHRLQAQELEAQLRELEGVTEFE